MYRPANSYAAGESRPCGRRRRSKVLWPILRAERRPRCTPQMNFDLAAAAEGRKFYVPARELVRRLRCTPRVSLDLAAAAEGRKFYGQFCEPNAARAARRR
ncbi:unnamed protein product, partial [Iphiclides podalirius]